MTADASVVVAGLAAWHDRHDAAAVALADVRVLPAHVMVETYSVLTRLPGGLAVPPATAAEVLGARFDAAPLRLDVRQRRGLLRTLVDVGVHGGASYDALVALEAQAHGHALLTLDERAEQVYRRLGVAFEAL